MTSKELFSIVIASFLWGYLWKRKRLLVHCDNEGAVKALNKGYSNKRTIAKLFRLLMFNSMSNNFTLKAEHIPDKKNIKADLLSLFQILDFRRLFPETDVFPTRIPEDVGKYAN